MSRMDMSKSVVRARAGAMAPTLVVSADTVKNTIDNKETEINICWTNEKRKLINDKYMKLAYKKDRTRYCKYSNGRF